jgi:hypothetical protein
MRQIIQATHGSTYETWLSRNSDLHQTDDADLAAIRSAELAEIRYYHGQLYKSSHLTNATLAQDLLK